jgi:hypothetical protein
MSQNSLAKKPKTHEWEVQYSVKWINFTATVQAIDEEEAIALSGKLDFDQFTTTAKNEEVSSLEDIFAHAGFPQANRTDDLVTMRTKTRNNPKEAFAGLCQTNKPALSSHKFFKYRLNAR